MDLGVDGVELDVRRTLDGALVVNHDPEVEGLDIATSIGSQLPSYVPTLLEALDALEGVRVNVEIKNLRDSSDPTYDETGDFARQVVSTWREAGRASSVMISSFDFTTCIHVRQFDQSVAVGWLLMDVDPRLAIDRASKAQFNAVEPHFNVVDAQLVIEARRKGLAVNVWTVNEKVDIEAMVSCEVASIITDNPALAMTLVGKRTQSGTHQ